MMLSLNLFSNNLKLVNLKTLSLNIIKTFFLFILILTGYLNGLINRAS
jgi:hypothetical protein